MVYTCITNVYAYKYCRVEYKPRHFTCTTQRCGHSLGRYALPHNVLEDAAGGAELFPLQAPSGVVLLDVRHGAVLSHAIDVRCVARIVHRLALGLALGRFGTPDVSPQCIGASLR